VVVVVVVVVVVIVVVKSPFGDDAWPVMVCVCMYECVSDVSDVSVLLWLLL
jgi:hypothetical protein